VKDDLGIPCLDELTKIDDARRQIMTSSEELKKRVKEAYATKQAAQIDEVREMVTQMKTTVDNYHLAMPFLLTLEDDAQEAENFEDEESGSDEDLQAQMTVQAKDQMVSTELCPNDTVATGEKKLKGATDQEGEIESQQAKGSSRAQRRGGQNQRGLGGQSKGKGNGWEMDSRGWNTYSADSLHSWGKKGLPQMDANWYGKGPHMPYPPPMYYEWWRDATWEQQGHYSSTASANAAWSQGGSPAHLGTWDSGRSGTLPDESHHAVNSAAQLEESCPPAEQLQ